MTKKSSTDDIRKIWYEAKNNNDFHLLLVKIFRHENCPNFAERMGMIEDVCSKNQVLFGNNYITYGFGYAEKVKYYFTSIIYLFKHKDALTVSERKYIIEYFLTHSGEMTHGLSNNTIGYALHKGFLTADEMVTVIEFAEKNNISFSYLNFSKFMKNYPSNESEQLWQDLKKIFYAFNDQTLVMQYLNYLYYDLNKIYAISKKSFAYHYTNQLKDKMVGEVINMLDEINKEKKIFNLLTTTKNKVAYLIYFSLVLSEQEQYEIVNELFQNKLGRKVMLSYIYNANREWSASYLDLKGRAKELYEALLIAEKMSK